MLLLDAACDTLSFIHVAQVLPVCASFQWLASLLSAADGQTLINLEEAHQCDTEEMGP